MAVFGPKLQLLKLRSATCESRSWPPPLSFLLKLCVIVLHTHRYHPPKFQANPKHHDGVLIFSHFARAACLLLAACCLLLAACCLLLACLLSAKPSRSTLDTKKGYKTKTGSTSSVTLTLTPTPPPSPLAGRPPDPRPDPRQEHPPPPGPPAGPPPPPPPTTAPMLRRHCATKGAFAPPRLEYDTSSRAREQVQDRGTTCRARVRD